MRTLVMSQFADNCRGSLVEGRQGVGPVKCIIDGGGIGACR